MHNVLNQFDPQTALNLLSCIALDYLPSPGIDDEVENNQDGDNNAKPDEQSKILLEIKKHLKLDSSDVSISANNKIISFISDLMQAYIVPREEERGIKERVGHKGLLRIADYNLEIGDIGTSKDRGISANHIKDTIYNADSIQHLLKGKEIDLDKAEVTLFAKLVKPAKKNKDNFFILIPAKRNRDNLVVDIAWRIYQSEVNFSAANKPLDILKSFVNQYGMPFKIGNSSDKKFFHYETVFIEDEKPISLISSQNNEKNAYESWALVKYSGLRVIEVSMAYMINISKYYGDLKKHNVGAKLQLPQKDRIYFHP